MNPSPQQPRPGGVRVRPPADHQDAPARLPALGELAGLGPHLARASLAGLLVFVAMWLVNAQALTNPIDDAIWRASLTWRTAALDTFFSALTQAFNTLPMTIYVLVALGIFTWRYRHPWPLIGLGATMVLAPLAVTVLKNLIDRPRPSLTHRLVEEVTFSFPSGHSTSTAALCAALFFTAYPALTQKGRRALGVGLGVLAVTIGFSRIYVGVHWASDVLGGLALGLAIACLVHLVLVTAYTKNQKS
ncbi:phosphatase PAP2 family protein [Rothia nasimurium]|uniref:phosphatase PAP2 family protein n=1 Tax=Rothia nasimurium TaxID=85336 RepID=UPI003BA356C9